MTAIEKALQDKILVLDGAMGTMLQAYKFTEEDFRAERFKDHPCSLQGNKKTGIESLIRKFNIKYKINKINKINSFELKSSNLRSYYYKNILAFGDLLHKIHPLAGQGFNMSIRDINKYPRISVIFFNLYTTHKYFIIRYVS